jgi:hypothetical protein
MSGSKIINCNCVHPYQDEKHGRGRRVANNKKGNAGAACTVCGRVHGSFDAKKK